MTVDPIVIIDNVSYTHWNQTAPTLKAVSLEILPGTLNVLVGPGGSGKSTLCSLFNGEIPHLLGGHMEGQVLVNGIDTSQTSVKDLSRCVVHMLQDPETMFATLYVEDEIAFGPENLLLDPQDIKEIVNNLLSQIQLEPQRHNLVWNLSGGQIQKLGLAVILAMKPAMIVLDEPTANLDPQATRQVHELVLELRQQGMTVLLVMRELNDFVLSHADQLLVLVEGSIMASGSVQKVLKEHGETMLDQLGIWLPETVEIGIGLQKRFHIPLEQIPLTVEETLETLLHHNLLPDALTSPTEPDNPSKQAEGRTLLISARNLTYEYPNGFQALKGVSFEVHSGEMLAIVGRNGAGKSTLAKLLVGLLKPQAGDLMMFNKPARQWKVEALASYIALVFQNPEHQFLTDTARDEIAYSLQSRGIVDPLKVQKLVDESLRQLELQDFAKTHPFALSAGKKRRLGVATMLVCHPQVLLVDEPTYGQDKEMTHTLMNLMEGIRATGVTIMMITHDMRLVQEYAQRVIVMSEGEITYTGNPADLFSSSDLLKAANLCPTLLQDLLATYGKSGRHVGCSIRTSEEFLDALEFSQVGEEKHGIH